MARQVIGAGHIASSPRRKPHYDDEVILAVQNTRDLVHIVVPFMDRFLPPSKKREQYLAWRRELLSFWENGARRRRPCTIEGCEALRRGKGVCRKHYYALYRK